MAKQRSFQIGPGTELAQHSPVDISPMADPQNKNEKTLVDNFADQAVVSNPISPEFAEPLAL